MKNNIYFIFSLCFIFSCNPNPFTEFKEIDDEKNYPNLILYLKDFENGKTADNSEYNYSVEVGSYKTQNDSDDNNGSFLKCEGKGGIKVLDLDLSEFSQITFSFWIKGYVGRNELLLSQGEINSESDSCYITIKNDKLILGEPEYLLTNLLDTLVLNGNWNMVTLVSSKINTSKVQSGYKIYINGELEAENNESKLFFVKDSILLIAKDFDNDLDNIRIYDKALMENEIVTIFKEEKLSFDTIDYPYAESENLFEYFTFDEKTIVDDKGSLSMISKDKVSFSLDTKSGKGYSLGLDKGYIEWTPSILGKINSFSMNFWMKSSELNLTLFSQGSELNEKIEIIDGIFLCSSDDFRFKYDLADMLNNSWNMVSFTCQKINSKAEGNRAKLYINGNLVHSSSKSDIDFNRVKSFIIGSKNQSSYKGFLDNIRIYNTVLDQKEIELIYDYEK